MGDKYILVDNLPVLEHDLLKWAKWFEDSKEVIILAQTHLPGDILVSTVFLGIDHRFLGKGAPILFETMIFRGPHDQFQERYTTRRLALEGHEKAVRLASTELVQVGTKVESLE